MSPLGRMVGAVGSKGVSQLDWSDQPLPDQDCNQRTEQVEVLRGQLYEYFAGIRTEFTVGYDVDGTAFELKVWQVTCTVPYGYTATYRWVAGQLHRPRAVRAVARALASNPVLIVIPCHRIVGSAFDVGSGSMGQKALRGYGAGIWRKAELLKLERPDSIEIRVRNHLDIVPQE